MRPDRLVPRCLSTFLLGAALLLCGCVAMVKTGPGNVTVKDGLTVTSDGNWNRLDLPRAGNDEIWTSDGLPLDTLIFYVGVREGEALVVPPTGSARKPPAFRAGMGPNEIVELYETSITQDGSAFKLDRLAPATFGGASGFRFEFTMVRKSDDVTLRGVAQGAVVKGRLYLVAFRATRAHYFAKHLPRAEALFRSALIKG